MDMVNKEDKSSKTSAGKQIREYAISIGFAIVIAIVLRTYVFARADVDGSSMESTLHDKDVIFVEKLSLISENIKRGQIIIFDSKNSKNEIYVKRVIGIEGDEIEIKEGKVYLNGSILKEDYLSENTVTKPGTFMTKNKKYKVEKGYIFVLGDNREHSTDSRELGPISLGDVKGHTIFRLYPFDKMRLFIK